jgi:hypothetical protein
MSRSQRTLTFLAFLAFAYAVLGNYVALPGYIRFLDRGGTSAAGNTMDMAVIVGAVRTILWMYSFSIGAMCLYLLSLRSRSPDYLRHGIGVCLVWLAFWSVPNLPEMPAVFYIVFGCAILVTIALTHLYTFDVPADRSSFLFSTAMLFFALATWDVCGLGATGRILHPDEVVLERSQQLLGAQTTKLMIALFIAWGCMAASRGKGNASYGNARSSQTGS